MTETTRASLKINTQADISGKKSTENLYISKKITEIPEGFFEDIPIDSYEEYKPMEMATPPKASGAVVLEIIEPKKLRGRPKGPDKLPLHQIQYDLIDWMAGKRTPDSLIKSKTPPFTSKFRTYYQDQRKRSLEIIEVENNLATISSEDVLYDEIEAAIKGFSGSAQEYCLPLHRIKEIAKGYLASNHAQRLKKSPPIFCWESQKDIIAFNRVPDPAPGWSFFYGSPEMAARAPIWCEFVSRCDCPDQFRQFMGSTFFPESSHKQTMHLAGPPNAAKTFMLENLFGFWFGGRGVAPFNVDNYSSSFINDDFVGRMVIFADEIKDFFYSTPDYKRLSGADNHRVEAKFKHAYHTKITAKFIATSNDIPSLPPDDAVVSRLVLIRVAELKNHRYDLDKFLDELKAEIPYIIADCIDAFKRLNGKPIQMPAGTHAESLELGSANLQEFFDDYFEFKPSAKSLPIKQFRSIIVKQGFALKINYKQMRQFVAQKYKAILDYPGWIDEKTTRVVTNIVAKSIPRIPGLDY